MDLGPPEMTDEQRKQMIENRREDRRLRTARRMWWIRGAAGAVLIVTFNLQFHWRGWSQIGWSMLVALGASIAVDIVVWSYPKRKP